MTLYEYQMPYAIASVSATTTSARTRTEFGVRARIIALELHCHLVYVKGV